MELLKGDFFRELDVPKLGESNLMCPKNPSKLKDMSSSSLCHGRPAGGPWAGGWGLAVGPSVSILTSVPGFCHLYGTVLPSGWMLCKVTKLLSQRIGSLFAHLFN